MNFNTSIPIYLQVIEDIKKQIVLGNLKPSEKLLSTKELALKYKINPNTAVRVYKELDMQNICEIKRGLGSFVTGSKVVISNLKKEMANEAINEFTDKMKSLGYSFDEMRKFIKESEEKKK
jgi:GntR family transcriptional regulator